MWYEQLDYLCSSIGTTPTAFVTNVLKLSSSKVTAWKQGSIPKFEILQKIAAYFDVTVGYLFDGDKKSNLQNFDEMEQRMPATFRQLSRDDKMAEVGLYASNNVAERIKFVAKSKNISVKKLLEDIGLGFNTMSNMKSSMPKADNLAKIADYLDCSTDYLLGRTDNLNSHKSQAERIVTFMNQYIFKLNTDDFFDADLSNEEIEKIVNAQLNYGWKLVRLEEKEGQRFLVLEWEKDGKPNVDPFERDGVYTKRIAAGEKESSQSNLITVSTAARNGGEPTAETITQEQLEALKKAKPRNY